MKKLHVQEMEYMPPNLKDHKGDASVPFALLVVTLLVLFAVALSLDHFTNLTTITLMPY